MIKLKTTSVMAKLKPTLTTFILFLSLIVTSSCKKSTDSNNDQYYVKYQLSSSTIYSNGRLNVVVKGDDDLNKPFNVSTNSDWEIVVGPVKRGFNASIAANELSNNFGRLRLQLRILISKNGSPFAIKQYDDDNAPRSSANINYQINY
jgi:hypothetical protein